MLDIKHLKLDRNGKRYLYDTSFQLARCGFVSITCDDAVAGEYLAYLLGGIVRAEEGCFLFEERDMAEERNRLYYRRECVSFLSGDFQLFPERSVEENILLHLSCEKKELDHVLRFWKLSDVRREALQDLPFEQQFYTALARCMLKKSRILVFYPAHSFLSEHEQRQIYPILRRLSSHMLIITVDAADTFPYHTRLIEIKEGYMESDSGQMELGYPDVPFYGRADVVEGDMLRLWKQCRRHYRWGYRGLRLFLIALLLMLSLLCICANMDTVGMQVRLLQRFGQSAFLIEKHAGDDGKNTYAGEYAQMRQEDAQLLQEALCGDTLFSYAPNDFFMANAYLNGAYDSTQLSFASYMAAYEAESSEELGISCIAGSYPETMDEAALTLSAARSLLHVEEHTKAEELLGSMFYWYGIPLTLSAVLEDHANVYMNQSANSVMPYMSTSMLFVKKGFIEEHPLSKMKSFPLSSRRILVDNRSVGIARIEGNASYRSYTSGSMVTESLHTLTEGEVVLDARTAGMLGFPYQEIFMDSTLSMEEKLLRYLDFAQEWVNKEISVQAYTSTTSPSASTIFRENLTIKGFLLPDDETLSGMVPLGKGNVYLHSSYLENILVSNAGIYSVYYHGNEQGLRQGLAWLEEHPQYEALIPRSLPFRLLVTDVRSLLPFLAVTSFAAGMLLLLLHGVLLKKTARRLRGEMTLYYIYGARLKEINRFYRKMIMREVKHGLYAANIISLLCSWAYLMILIWKLTAPISLFIYLLCAPLLSLCLYVLLLVIAAVIVKTSQPVEKWYTGQRKL